MAKKEVKQYRDLSEKQVRFAEAYVINGGNGTAACREAGYSDKSINSLSVQAFENLKNTKVTDYIKQLRKEIALDFGVTSEEVIDGLRFARRCAFNVEPILDKDGFPTGEFRLDLPSGIRATELLGKILGMFVDKTEMTLNPEDLATLVVRQVEEIKQSARGEDPMATEEANEPG